ncbi:DNA/RNA helicase domain-containing protein [Caenimonas koreensis]|uniref:DNA/RNA helicase domain-containing protein n=1 Tax=Caenimonas koreensis TaxID=367474 RepID=UPI003782F17B
MIVYQATKSVFLRDTHTDDIERIVGDSFRRTLGWTAGASEVRSWKESLTSMAKVLIDEEIPDDVGVAIEFNIPQSSKRVDLLLTGKNQAGEPRVIVVELKQWQSAQLSAKDAVVSTYVGGSVREVSHPSYQAWSYAALLEGFNEAVYDGGISLRPCAYLHNYQADSVIGHAHYATYVERAPVFLAGADERQKLCAFIKQHVKYGDDLNLLYKIDNGRIRPSKMLADSLVGMLQGKQEFVLIDDQKVVFESALALARQASADSKRVLIVNGGPGTGKSVVAINLLARLTQEQQNSRYVSRNAAPRAVYEARLTGSFRATHIRNLFSGSGAFVETQPAAFDTLIVDEAHRLNEKSGLYANLGTNQIKELIDASSCSVFFLDEDQRVTWNDIGSRDLIRSFAQSAGAQVSEMSLESQFRCSGSDGYLAWLDNALGVRKTANPFLEDDSFDFRIFDSPTELHAAIREKNKRANKARVVAGYCWDWASKRDPLAYDIVIPHSNYSKRWNLDKSDRAWIIAADSIEEVGCIHTCQGLELDYVGVIIGDDFVVRGETIVCRAEKRSRHDRSIRGWKAARKHDPSGTKARLDSIIKNTYRTLMTRGMKGCYVYCTDQETAAYFRSRLRKVPSEAAAAPQEAETSPEAPSGNVLPFRVLKPGRVRPYQNAVPLFDLKIAAGSFGDFQSAKVSDCEWVELPAMFSPQPGMFVAQVVGESMNRRIQNGAWCLFRANPTGTRVGKVVVAQHRSIEDPELGGSFTVKVYRSAKRAAVAGEWRHTSISLEPDSDDPSFRPLVFGPDAGEDLRIVAELICVLS